MGMGATDTVGRVMASVGMLGDRPAQFEAAMDVVNGGVVLSLPALLANGLLRHTDKYFQLPAGYYGIVSIFLLLAMMALCRLKHPESLRYSAPGEWGKLLGLDRIPEVKTLRKKLKILSEKGQTSQWGAQLCEDWMEASAGDSRVLYVDGHVRVYHGEQTKLPRHYVSRQRLCLRATTDYWVNAMDGRPYFVINEAVDPGLIDVLSKEIVPRLISDVPAQPTEQQLKNDPLLHRLTIVFDREGYSPKFLRECWDKRVACVTYNKYPGPDWRVEEFVEYSVSVNQAPPTTMKLAERGVKLSNGLWVREVRKLSESGHQTSVLTTQYGSEVTEVAAQMFARWTQENFFRYMRHHFCLDRLIDYQTEPLDETTRVVNPDWRNLDGQVRSKVGLLHRKLSKFGKLQLTGDIEPSRVEQFESEKAKLLQQIHDMEAEIADLKRRRKATAHHITARQLPEDQRFSRLNTKSKDFIDLIKMIAYRAETAMALMLREHMTHLDDARALLREIYSTEADMIPDLSAGTLTIRIHHMANRAADTVVQHLCDELNATETLFPGTNLRLVYELVRGTSTS